MGIKHTVVKVKGEQGLATEWNDDHEIDGDVDFDGNEAQNLIVHSGAVFPASPVEGQMFYRTDLSTLYFYDGDSWAAWIEATIQCEFYDAGDDTKVDVWGANYAAQTFTTGTVGTAEKVILRSVKLKLYKVLAPGTVYVALKAVDGAFKPTGPDLAVGEINAYSITDDTAGGWYDVVMSPYEMQQTTQYAIVLRVPGGSAANYICWRVDSAGATYAGGSQNTSADSGATWAIDAAADFMFEVWGTRVYELIWEVDGADLQMTTSRPMDMRTQQIHNVVDPTAAQDAATKNYADKFRYEMHGGELVGSLISAASAQFVPVGISTIAEMSAAPDARRMLATRSGTIKKLYAKARVNTATNDCRIGVMVEGGGTTVVIPAGSTAVHSITFNRPFVAGDRIQMVAWLMAVGGAVTDIAFGWEIDWD